MERDYLRLRNAETRYRMLFQITSEAVVIVDAASGEVVDANPAAAQLLQCSAGELVGAPFPVGVARSAEEPLREMLTAARVAGRADEVLVEGAKGGSRLLFSASLFRQEQTSHFLVRIREHTATVSNREFAARTSMLFDVIDAIPDGFVVTNEQAEILTANRAFLELAQLAAESQAKGKSLSRWLGRPGVDLGVLSANLRQHGSVRLFATRLRGEFGATTDVEISAVLVPFGDGSCFGFTIRNIGRRIRAVDSVLGEQVPRSVEDLAELIGQVPLKDIVRQTTDLIERLCIEAALKLTHDNRASAAEMLGLSRQGLYTKLRRYGLGDLELLGDD
jgi:transcriptional regulator PpsR